MIVKTEQSERLISRLINGDFGKASKLLDGQPDAVKEWINDLAVLFGDSGYFEGAMGDLAGMAVAVLQGETTMVLRHQDCAATDNIVGVIKFTAGSLSKEKLTSVLAEAGRCGLLAEIVALHNTCAPDDVEEMVKFIRSKASA